MFLFTNAPVGARDTGSPAAVARAPASPATAPADGAVVAGIRDGAQSTGVGFDYLLATAQRESSLNPAAKAGTSSATGLFQFIEQTWLGTMKSAGAGLGLSTYADAITTRGDGTYGVADPGARQAILDLRRDPRVSATLAGALTQRNREALTASLGHEPTSGDLYAAHVLGAKGAAALIAGAQASPARAAALDLPDAAAANRGLFYDRGGRARGAAELYAMLANATAGTSGAAVPTTAGTAPATAEPPAPPLEGGIRALFQTDRRPGAVSEGVAKLWQGRAAGAEAARPAPTWFPHGDGSERAPADPQIDPADPATTGSIAPATVTATTLAGTPSAGSAAPILVPLPPRRPAALGAQARTASATPSPSSSLVSPSPRSGP